MPTAPEPCLGHVAGVTPMDTIHLRPTRRDERVKRSTAEHQPRLLARGVAGRVPRLRATGQRHHNGVQKLPNVDRLVQDIPNAQGAGFYMIRSDLVGCNNQNLEGTRRDLKVKFTNDLKPRPIGQAEVQEDKVRLEAARKADRLGRGGRAQQSDQRQVRLQNCGNEQVAHLVILDAEDAAGYRRRRRDVLVGQVGTGGRGSEPVPPELERAPYSKREV